MTSRIVARHRRYRDDTIAALKALDDEMLEAFVERSRHRVRDGYPASSGESDVHGGRYSDPVSRTVESNAGGRDDPGVVTPDTWIEPADPVRAAIADLWAMLAEIAGLARQLDRTRIAVQLSAVHTAGRQTSTAGSCGRCRREVAGTTVDPLRAGLCVDCHRDWVAAGRPERRAVVHQDDVVTWEERTG